jgi:DNA-binding transcriptional regulator WhiA
MPLRLQTVSKLREEYPESSLEELSLYSENIFGKQMSKSGISHCFRDLMEYYKNIINKKNNV